MHDDWIMGILMFALMTLLIGVVVGLPAMAYYDYNLESQCIRSRNIKSDECFALFIHTGRNVNLNTQNWEH